MNVNASRRRSRGRPTDATADVSTSKIAMAANKVRITVALVFLEGLRCVERGDQKMARSRAE